MSAAITTVAVIAAIGSALVGGIFYAFSSFVMKALARRPAEEGIAAMQSINVVVLNRSFLWLFMGTAALSLVLAIAAVLGRGAPAAPYWLAGAIAYVLGTFAVTVLGNVPLNERLAMTPAAEPASLALWERYLDRWTWLNTVRSAAATVAASMFIVGLMRPGVQASFGYERVDAFSFPHRMRFHGACRLSGHGGRTDRHGPIRPPHSIKRTTP